MAVIQKHGFELHRYLSKDGHLFAIMSDGTRLVKTFNNRTWRVYSTKKPDCDMQTWRDKKEAFLASLPAWQRETKKLPTLAELEEWDSDGVCETPSGDRVEPDGEGPDGAPSWLRVLGMI